ncbi:MAG: cyclodeaminase/cyclohydrolase family protein [Bacteroidetes bacterium]|nr:cyclodeaminase/cyclohydrolase family protein [Bacteroidota bacterium]
MLKLQPISKFLDITASDSPAPGGGSVSALAASLGAALGSMVCRITMKKNANVAIQIELESVLIKCEKLRDKFTMLIDEDTNAFKKVIDAYRLPKETAEQSAHRNAAIQSAYKDATVVPILLLELCAEAIALLKIIGEKGNKNTLSDAGVGVLMIGSACEGAVMNARINIANITDLSFVEANKIMMNSLQSAVTNSAHQILYRINERLFSY